MKEWGNSILDQFLDEDKEYVIKMMLCVIFGLILSKLLNNENSMTISVTAMLVCYTDRSKSGARTYGLKRFKIQVVMALLSALFLSILQALLPLPTWIIAIIASVFVVAIGSWIDLKVHIAPLVLTTSITGILIVTTTVKMPNYPLLRLCLVAIGCVLGYVIDFVIVRKRRPSKIERKIDAASKLVLEKLKALDENHFQVVLSEGEKAKAVKLLTDAQAAITLDLQDKNLNQKKDINRRQKMALIQMKDFVALLNKLLKFMDMLGEVKKEEMDTLDELFKKYYFAKLQQLLMIQSALWDNFVCGRKEPIDSVETLHSEAHNKLEIHLLWNLMEYADLLDRLIEDYSQAIERCKDVEKEEEEKAAVIS